MANDPQPPPRGDSSFLGGGPKFNQAGLNTPMPGERTAHVADPKLPFGGPRVYAGVVIVLALVVLLYFVVGQGLGGVVSRHGGGAVHSTDAPSDNPDAPSGQ